MDSRCPAISSPLWTLQGRGRCDDQFPGAQSALVTLSQADVARPGTGGHLHQSDTCTNSRPSNCPSIIAHLNLSPATPPRNLEKKRHHHRRDADTRTMAVRAGLDPIALLLLPADRAATTRRRCRHSPASLLRVLSTCRAPCCVSTNITNTIAAITTSILSPKS